MKQTLQTRYTMRKTQTLRENVKKADKRLIYENRQANLLLEAMDEQDLQKASAIIDKFRKMKGKGIKSIDVAIDKAETQLNKYTGGGPLTQAWTKLKGVLGLDNPLVKFMTLANALEVGFRQLPTIIKNNIGELTAENQDKTLASIITDPAKQKIVIDNMLKALSPKGFFSAFKKIPFVDKQALVQELMNVPIKTIISVIKQGNSGPSSNDIAADIKDTAMKGGTTTKGTQETQPGQPTTGTSGTSPTKNSGSTTPSTPTGENPQRQVNVVDSIYKELSNVLVDAAGDEKRAKAVLKVLADEGKLKT
jgi:hypothetical protein